MVEFFYTIPSNVSDKCRLYCIFVGIQGLFKRKYLEIKKFGLLMACG